MQPYQYFSIGLLSTNVTEEQRDALEAMRMEFSSFTEDDRDGVYSITVLQSPWSAIDGKKHKCGWHLDLDRVEELLKDKDKLLEEAKAKLIENGLESLAEHVNIYFHVTEV